MFSLWQLGALALGYVLVLFVIAWWGDRAARTGSRWVSNAWVYSLGLGVYCTSWTFYGAVGEAANHGWTYLPIYLGPVVMLLLGGALIYKLVSVGQQQHITSIADFLAARYGKSRRLAVLVTIVAIVGVLPYIALQLQAVTISFEESLAGTGSAQIDTALMVAGLMALFTILFGTRHIDATEHQSGLMLAVAFESLLKLIAFVAVGLFCAFWLFDSPRALWQMASEREDVLATFSPDLFSQSFVTAFLLSMVAIICLPRQFHAGVVENRHLDHLRTARRLVPGYLLLFAIFVLPIALAGMILQPELLPRADIYMLSLSRAQDNAAILLVTFFGGIAAATGMVIVSTMALAIMLTNEVLLPWWLRIRMRGGTPPQDFSMPLRILRRVSIVLLLVLAFVFHSLMDRFTALASIGLLSFAAVAQLAPALFGGLYWRRGHKNGALAGLSAGFIVWLYCLLLPAVLPADWVGEWHRHGLFGIAGLRPHALFGIEGLEPLAHGVFWSLLLNIAAYIGFSRQAHQAPLDESQATRFVDAPTDWWREGLSHPSITIGELLEICQRGLGASRATPLFADYLRRRGVPEDADLLAPLHLVRFVERLLAGSMGASTARIVMSSLLRQKNSRHEDVARLMDEASELIQFNHQLLRTTIETISQGICVVDRDLGIVAWNQAYVRLFNYPEGLIRLGRPIREVYLFNARRGFYGDADIESAVARRVELLRNGNEHRFERELPNGTVIEVRGSPMVGGGFVSTYMDITERKQDEQALRQINENLEVIVAERTRRLSELNMKLAQANEGKTRFLAAAGHDLMQPLNAAQLFVASLGQSLRNKPENDAAHERVVLEQIDSSLRAAEQILFSLLEISKLDSGAMNPQRQPVLLSDLMSTLGAEFAALAAAEGLSFDLLPSSAVIDSDINLLRRVLQNLLSNAIRYTPHGRVLFGCRRVPGGVRLEVWDTGPGIPQEQHERIFREFQRLPQHSAQHVRGLGLGLAIADRICRLLGHPLTLRSWSGRGTVFAVTVPLAKHTALVLDPAPASLELRNVSGTRVFCVDNDAALLSGLVTVLEGLGCQVTAASGLQDAIQVASGMPAPDVLLVDYQLGDGDGFDVIRELDGCWDDVVPAVLMTADRRAHIRARAADEGVGFIQKPITEEALMRVLQSL